jgi:hypothetical protein
MQAAGYSETPVTPQELTSGEDHELEHRAKTVRRDRERNGRRM